MQRNLDSFFKPKKRSSPVPDHNPPLSQTQGSDSSLQNESQMDSAATSVTESTEYVSLSKTESRQCGPPYPDVAECMNDAVYTVTSLRRVILQRNGIVPLDSNFQQGVYVKNPKQRTSNDVV
jgi:hypothetical protein